MIPHSACMTCDFTVVLGNTDACSLDHWLNANHSLAVGSINSQATPLDPTGMGFLPFAPNTNPLSTLTFNFPSGPASGSMWDDPSISSLGGMSLPSGLSAMNGAGLGGISLDLVGMMGSDAAQPSGSNGPTSTLGRGLTQPGLGRGRSNSGLEGSLSGGGADNGPGPEGENSDEYWNALIDGEWGQVPRHPRTQLTRAGILGTTGGLGSGAT